MHSCVKKITNPHDLAGIEAYCDYYYSWRGWWIHAVELIAGIGLTYLLMQWFDWPWYVAVILGFCGVLIFAAYVAVAWFMPNFYVSNYKTRLFSIIPWLFGGVIVGMLIGSLMRLLQKGRLPTLSEHIEILLNTA
jgi:hypothetical protein